MQKHLFKLFFLKATKEELNCDIWQHLPKKRSYFTFLIITSLQSFLNGEFMEDKIVLALMNLRLMVSNGHFCVP